jgi:protein-tyrosine phosphatase
MANNAQLKISKILPFVYVSSFNGIRKHRSSVKHKFGFLINATDKGQNPLPGVKIPTLPLNTSDDFDLTFQWIQFAVDSKKRILVFCEDGMNRSPTIVMSYLIRRWKCSSDFAFRFVKARRPIVQHFQKSEQEPKLESRDSRDWWTLFREFLVCV